MGAALRVAVVVAGGGRTAVVAAGGLGRWLAAVAPASARGDVCVSLVSDSRMRALNRQYRRIDRPTDVLSFPTERKKGVSALGDVVIAAGAAARQAREAGHGLRIELRVLALHGLLHLLGFDHEVDEGRMARAEARLRKRGGLPVGLVERAQGASQSTAARSRPSRTGRR